jgi:spore coat polysaccharide biosynthesis protein SpsF (cytidylyltransferase family)
MQRNKTVAIVQARMGSTRLPGKVMIHILGKPMLWYLIERLRRSKFINKIVIATSMDKEDDIIEKFSKKNKIDFYRGSKEDVLDRYYKAASKYNACIIIRITADCPLIDPEIVNELASYYFRHRDLDYIHTGQTYPEGMGLEVFSFAALEKTWKQAKLKSEREHVTTFIWKNKDIFKIKELEMQIDYSHIRITVDERADFEIVKAIFEHFYSASKSVFGMQEIINFLNKNKDVYDLNKHIVRREGYKKSLLEDRYA